MKEVKIGSSIISEKTPVFIIGEIGINHNGNLSIAKLLIDLAAVAGCNAVKFQKRTVTVVYTSEELAKPREVPKEIVDNAMKRGALPSESIERLKRDITDTTNGDLKYSLEFERTV